MSSLGCLHTLASPFLSTIKPPETLQRNTPVRLDAENVMPMGWWGQCSNYRCMIHVSYVQLSDLCD